MRDIGGFGDMEKIKIGISSCLLGNKVRFDGQHKHDRFITGTLGEYCEFIPICPEVECGLPVPREAMRLIGTVEKQRLVTNKTGIDHSDRMLNWASVRLEKLEKEEPVAFIFKSKSPSSGLRAVKIYKEDGNVVSHSGRGLFAQAFVEKFPDIPVEDEGRLNDAVIRENFIETIFTMQRWREVVRDGSPKALVDFHTRHKYALMAHSPEKMRLLGKLVSDAGGSERFGKQDMYREILGQTLAVRKTRKKTFNVLLHIVGYFKKNLSPDEKKELIAASERYHEETAPLIVPLTLINHYVMKYSRTYLEKQTFLNPHPIEMGLLNHV